MASYNQVLLIGNLTREPELRFTAQGKAVCEFTLAVNGVSRANGEATADFVGVTAWEKQAETSAKFLHKGSLVHVAGRLKLDRWETEGEKRSRLSVVASSVTFLGGSKKDGTVQAVGVPSAETAVEADPAGEEIPEVPQ